MARRPRPTVSPSSTSAMRTNRTMTRAVKNSPMARAAARAMVMDSSIVMRRASEVGDRLLEDRVAAHQRRHQSDHVEAGDGFPQPQQTGQDFHSPNQLATTATATRPIRTRSTHSRGMIVVLVAVFVVLRFGVAASGVGFCRGERGLVHGATPSPRRSTSGTPSPRRSTPERPWPSPTWAGGPGQRRGSGCGLR